MSKTFEDRWEMLKNHFPDLCTEEFRRVAWNFYEYGKIDGGREELVASTARKAMAFIDDCLSQAHRQIEGTL